MGLMGGVRGIGLWPRLYPWQGRAEQRGQGSDDGRTSTFWMLQVNHREEELSQKKKKKNVKFKLAKKLKYL